MPEYPSVSFRNQNEEVNGESLFVGITESVTDITKVAPPVATIDLMGDSKYQEILPEVSVSLP